MLFRSDAASHTAYIRRYWSELEPHTRGYYSVVAEDKVGTAAIRANFEGNFQRMVALKDRYDPRNHFRLNANIKPTAMS